MKYPSLSVACSLIVLLSGCEVVNEKIEVADEAANRMVGKLDNSKINQTINNSLDSVGEKAAGLMPEAVRPPTERLGTDESSVLGVVPDPETASPVIGPVADSAHNAAQAEAGSADLSEPARLPRAPGDDAQPAGPAVAPMMADGQVGGGPTNTVATPAPVVLAPGSAAVATAEKELSRAAAQAKLELPADTVEFSTAGVSLKRVNIRLGPGTDHEILDTIEAGTPLKVAGKTSDGWLLIERGGQAYGFILGSLVRTAE